LSSLEKVTSKQFGNLICDIYVNDRNDLFMTAEQIGQALEYAYPRESINKLFERNKERLSSMSVEVRLTSSDGKEYETRIFNEKGIYEIARKSSQAKADVFYDWVYEVIEEVRRGGSYQNKPKSQAELSLIMAQSLVQQEQRMKDLERQIFIANERINNIDKVDLAGDEQQQFNKLIRAYARKTGRTFQQAYRDFKGAFNIAFHTNTTAIHENYMMKNKKCTLPEFLVATNRIEDAIRIADKMLNEQQTA
jgi:prophage antirepressor-like protein